MHSAPSFTLELCPSSEGLVVLFGPTDAGAWGRWIRNLDAPGLRLLSQGVLSSVASSTRRGRPRGDAESRLAAAGAALADGALPAEVKRALAEIGPGAHLRLILHGAASQAPWEAMVVGEGPLFDRLRIGRHVTVDEAPAAAPHFGGSRVLVVADPAGDLPHARREGEAVASLLGAGDSGCSITLRAGPLRRVELLSALRECDALHFAGHADPEGWRLADAPLAPVDVEALTGGARRPSLVFAHACRSADPGEGRDGVLRALLKAGATHALGTLWDIPDETAPTAGAAFWRAVMTGGSAGEGV